MSDSARNQQVDEAIAAFLQAEEAGTPLDREAFLTAHAELRAELESFLSARALLQRRVPVDEDATIPPSSSPVAPLDVVRYFGDYEVIEELARGGMGVVFRARQVSLNRVVALKMILSGSLAGPEDVRRFRSEAESAANLDHPNICPIYEVGEHHGQQYYSMKLIAGGSMAGRMTHLVQHPREAAELLAKVADAVHHAHVRGILHRDLKPANVLLDEAGVPYVTDFGLARRVEGDSGLTQTGAIVGTPSYMAPEQASARKDLTTAVDTYALGAMLYECLTGQPPFRGETPLDVVLQVIEKEPERPRNIDPKIDRDLETIALKCLEKEPGRRYGSAKEVAEELGRWVRGEPIVARPAGRMERAWRWARRNPVLAGSAAAILAALVVVAAMGWVMVSKDRLRLREAYIERARAERIAGNRWPALEAVEQAAKLGRGDDLREEAILALATPGIRLEKEVILSLDDPARKQPNLGFEEIDTPGEVTEPAPEGLPAKAVVQSRSSNGLFALVQFDKEKTWGLWDVRARRVLRRVPPSLALQEGVVDDSGTWLAYRDGNDPDLIRVWCWSRGQTGARLTGTSGDMYPKAYSSKGALLASTQFERRLASLRLHEITTGRLIASVYGVHPIRWSRDGRYLLTKGVLTRKPGAEFEGRVITTLFDTFRNERGEVYTYEAKAGQLWQMDYPVAACRIGEAVNRLHFDVTGKRLIVDTSVWEDATEKQLIVDSGVWEYAGDLGAGLLPSPFTLPGGVLGFADEEVWGANFFGGKKMVGELLWATAAELVGQSAALSQFGIVPATVSWTAGRILADADCPRLVQLSGGSQSQVLHNTGYPEWMATFGTAFAQGKAFVPVYRPVHQSWSPDGEWLATVTQLSVGWGKGGGGGGVGQKALDLWSRRSGQRENLGVFTGRITLAFNHAGDEFAVAAERSLSIRNTAKRTERLLVRKEHFDRLAWSHHGNRLLAVRDEDKRLKIQPAAHVFDTTTGKELATRPPDPGNWLCFAFSPDGRWIVRGGEDRYLRIEDSHTGKLLVRWQAHDAAVTALAFSPDGKTLVTGGRDGMVRAWPIPYLREELAKLGLDWE